HSQSTSLAGVASLPGLAMHSQSTSLAGVASLPVSLCTHRAQVSPGSLSPGLAMHSTEHKSRRGRSLPVSLCTHRAQVSPGSLSPGLAMHSQSTSLAGVASSEPRHLGKRTLFFKRTFFPTSSQRLSRIRVTGPSLVSSTCIIAPNTPVSTGTPWDNSCWLNRW
ncbi:hypothetical protein C8P63_1171, partial [Melghirimyces profundicolus]